MHLPGHETPTISTIIRTVSKNQSVFDQSRSGIDDFSVTVPFRLLTVALSIPRLWQIHWAGSYRPVTAVFAGKFTDDESARPAVRAALTSLQTNIRKHCRLVTTCQAGLVWALAGTGAGATAGGLSIVMVK